MKIIVFKILKILAIWAACVSLLDAGCPVTDNPTQMFQCLTINPQAFVDLISKGDYKSFCHMANGYMTCMTTYVRDCIGGKAATGILEELQDLNLKCCISGRTQDCIVKNPALLQKCFSADNTVTLANGKNKKIIEVESGEYVKAVDSNGNIVDTQVLSILHKNTNSTTLFQTFYDSNDNFISLTNTHLIYVKNSGYIRASGVRVNDILRFYNQTTNIMTEFSVARIIFELKSGFIAPLTNEGTLLVNGIDASCYAQVKSHRVGNIFMWPIKQWYKIRRLLFTESTTTPTRNENVEIHFYSNFLYQFALNLLPSYVD